MNNQAVKDRFYNAWADTAKAFASPRRIEILDLLAQGERSVDAIARETGLTINNTSSHLTVLKSARLVETRKEAQFVFYRLADDTVVSILRGLQELARRRQHDVDHLLQVYVSGRDGLEPVTAAELKRQIKAGEVTVIDLRPALEYEAGHIRGAISMPLEEIETRLAEIPTDHPVVAYCHGQYCMDAAEAVERLRASGVDVRRLVEGLPDWRLAGYAVATGAGDSAQPRAS